jgi:hypothetical protein
MIKHWLKIGFYVAVMAACVLVLNSCVNLTLPSQTEGYVLLAFILGVVAWAASRKAQDICLRVMRESRRKVDPWKDHGTTTTFYGSQSKRVIDILRNPKVQAEIRAMNEAMRGKQ